MTATDPNGWVKNPPSTFVVIQNTSREQLNGQFGLVLQYSQDRYVCILTETPRLEPKSFKAEHLRKTNMVEQLRAQYQLVMNDPSVMQQVTQGLAKVKKITGLDAQYFAGLLLVLLIASIWFLGFGKTMMLISFLVMASMVLLPAYLETNSVKGMILKAPDQLARMLRESNLPFANKIASNKLYMALLVGFLLAFFVSAMLPKSAEAAVSTSSGSSFWSKSAATTSSSPITALDIEHYYKLGFDDATQEKLFGTSLPKTIAPKPTGPHRADADIEFLGGGSDNGDYHADSAYTSMPKTKSKSSLFSIGNGMCVFAILRTINELGRNAEGSLDLPLLWAKLQVQPVWRLGLLGLSVYRLVSAVLASL